MGEHFNVRAVADEQQRAFMRALLNDLHALEEMLQRGLFETGVRRIGAEQEMFLVDARLRPAPVSVELLERVQDPRLTTEIARFNLEANLSPLVLAGDCFSRLENEIRAVVGLARQHAQALGADVLLAGILPTLRQSDLGLENLTPIPRYFELNNAITNLRGGPVFIHIKGLDEIRLTHENVLMEACNTSFQVHLQVAPAEFAQVYNLAQLVTAPVLAAAANSPVLFGQRLWHETRLALFQHSVDARGEGHLARNAPRRVQFGSGWVNESILELFKEDIARFRVILTANQDEDAMAALARGDIPQLYNLRLHNGTVWRWNRPCYGVANDQAHLRIENRVLPAGPTIVDEVANAAFFIGLLCALPEEYGDIRSRLAFDDAKANFVAAARQGLQAQFRWLGGQNYTARTLILNQLLPLARQGLRAQGVGREEVDKYLGLVHERVGTGQTGAQWVLGSLAGLGENTPREAAQHAVTAALLANQKADAPVHQWPLLQATDAEKDWASRFQTVGQIMSTDLFTVRPDDLVDLAANVMEWRHVRHVPVENDQGQIVGLVSHRTLLRLLARGLPQANLEPLAVRDVMISNPLTVTPATPTLVAMNLMRSEKVGCLPVIERGCLVGIVTAYDFLAAAAHLLEKHLDAGAHAAEA
jgi:CBS domain-containing protein